MQRLHLIMHAGYAPVILALMPNLEYSTKVLLQEEAAHYQAGFEPKS
jgi:hypothetical protein